MKPSRKLINLFFLMLIVLSRGRGIKMFNDLTLILD